MKQLGKIQTLAALNSAEDMVDHAEEQRKNREAESAWMRKHVWDWQGDGESDDMRQTVLGDINNITQPAASAATKSAAWLMPLLLGMSIPGAAGLGALAMSQFMASKPTENPSGYSDETIEIGLGRIEDYLRD